MGLFDFLKPRNEKTKSLAPAKVKENEVHFAKVEKFVGGEIVAFAYFPKFPNDLFGVEIIKDDFTKEVIQQPFYIHSRKSDKVLLLSKYSTVFMIGLRTIKEVDYLTLEAYQKEIKFLENDKLSLLFEDESIWEFEIKGKGVRKDKDSDGVLYETKIEITIDELTRLQENSIVKWKYLNYKTNQIYTNEIDLEKQNMVKEMALMMKLIKNVEIQGL